MIISKVVQINNVFMVNVLNIQMIRKAILFVNVIKDGLENIVIFHIHVHVHLIHYVLVFQQTIDLFVFVLSINGVLNVYFIILYVNRIKMTTCQNGGQCIPVDEHMISDKKFFCICPKGFSGERCEILDTKINCFIS